MKIFSKLETGNWIGEGKRDTRYWIDEGFPSAIEFPVSSIEFHQGYWRLDTGNWIDEGKRDTGYWILDTRYWIDEGFPSAIEFPVSSIEFTCYHII